MQTKPQPPAWKRIDPIVDAYKVEVAGVDISIEADGVVWRMYCGPVGIHGRALKSGDLTGAQQEAFAIVAAIVAGWHREMQAFMTAQIEAAL